MDAIEQEARAPLRFPCGAAPAAGEAKEVRPGLFWLRMKLPIILDHINVWALADRAEDRGGWAIVDTGVNIPTIREAWDIALAGPLGGAPATRVFATHMHPDHIGLAGWLTERFGARLWTTRLEYFACRMLVADTGRAAPEDGARFHHAAGWSEPQIQRWRERFGGFGKAVYAVPDSYRRIVDGERLEIGGREWRVIVGSGHSFEHACLYCPELAVLIAGDQVLPKISSNVSVFATEPDGDPLGDWLASLAKIKREVPDEVLVLPSHGEPFEGLHARIDDLISGHETSLTRLERRLAEPRRAVDVFGALFARPIDDGLLGMATGESLAHLNHLMARGLAVRETDEAGVWWFRRA